MMEEMCIEVNEKNERIGLRPRSDFRTGKYIYRSVHVFLFNSKGELLQQKRSPTKRLYPDVWDSSVSGTVAEEEVEECVKREMEEEIGLDASCEKLFTYKSFSKENKEYVTLFLAKSDEEITPDGREMSTVRWISLDALRKDVEKHPEDYTPSFLEGIKTYFGKYCNN